MTKNRVLAGAVSVLALAALPATASASSTRTIEVRDLCDPVSFNAVLGPDTCDRPAGDRGGVVTFDELIAELTAKQSVGGWSFSRDEVTLRAGESLQIQSNRGGEFHTFAEVPAFGPGCVPPLNALTFPGQDPTPPAICDDQTVFETTGIVPGSGFTIMGLPMGMHHFQCLIHPWMRTTVTVR